MVNLVIIIFWLLLYPVHLFSVLMPSRSLNMAYKYNLHLKYIFSFASLKTNKRDISDVHEMDIYSFWYLTLSLLKFPLSVVKGIFFTVWYFIKALLSSIVCLKCLYFQVVDYLSEYYLGCLFWIPTALLTFVKVKFSFQAEGCLCVDHIP